MLLIFSIAILSICNSQDVKTLTYFQNDSIKLDLDLYLPRQVTDMKIPVVMFAFGGGFSTGNKESEKDYALYLAQHGFAVASISYTLYMKGKDFGCNGVLTEKIKAIQLGVSDLWQATAFILQQASQYNLDSSKVFISGISAGAEISFHACFWDYKLMNLYPHNLPEHFKYAGLIGGSGAIMDLNLINLKNAIPMLLSHGNSDKTVPYAAGSHRSCNTNATGWLILFGSSAVYNHLISLKQSAILITFDGGGHEYSGYLFHKEPHYILQFLKDVLAQKKFSNTIVIPSMK